MALSMNKEAEIIKEITSKAESVAKIKKYLLCGEGKHEAYRRLETIVHSFGPRFSGTQALEDAIQHVYSKMGEEPGITANLEEAMISRWVRGEESAELVSPRNAKIVISSLGSSVGTKTSETDFIEADIVVVRSFDELHKLGQAEVTGKIVVYNQEWVKEHKYPIDSYVDTVKYRNTGASVASRLGAVATLIRSVTPFSLGTVHTGWQDYDKDVKKIPAACITVEDAEMLQSLYINGPAPRIRMKMGAQQYDDTPSYNVIGEIKGKDKPNEIVLIGGHIDSWDICDGAMDDGGGFVIAWEVLSILARLGLQPKRTIRAVVFTGEESNFGGAIAYFKQHVQEEQNYSIMFESDDGTFTPSGIRFSGSIEAKAILELIGNTYLQDINAANVFDEASVPDLEEWQKLNVPTGSLSNIYEGERYFWYHHSPADRMNIQDPDEMDLCTFVWAVYAFVLADMEEKLPR